MAKIISMSLSEQFLKEIDSARKETGFSGRSETMRAGMKLLLDDLRAKQSLRGHVECVLVFSHGKRFEDSFTRTKHRYENIINTQIHSNFCNDKCLQLCVLHGQAEKINAFFDDIRKNKRTEYVKLVVP